MLISDANKRICNHYISSFIRDLGWFLAKQNLTIHLIFWWGLKNRKYNEKIKVKSNFRKNRLLFFIIALFRNFPTSIYTQPKIIPNHVKFNLIYCNCVKTSQKCILNSQTFSTVCSVIMNLTTTSNRHSQNLVRRLTWKVLKLSITTNSFLVVHFEFLWK